MTTETYHSRREQRRLSSLQPFTEEELDTIKAAQRDFWTFLNTVYAASFEGEEFLHSDGTFGNFSLGRLHRTWAHTVAGISEGPRRAPYSRWRIMAPRLHLKSTVLGRGYIFWRFFSEGQDVDAFYFDFKKPLADEHVTMLKRDILKNPYCRFWSDNNPVATSIIDFTVSFGEKESDDAPLKSWRVECEGEGILSATRGRHPKIVICDDILSDFANPIESVEIDRINQVFEHVVMSLPPPDGMLGVVGTPQSPYDILHKLQENDLFWCAEFPAVTDYETKKTVWPGMYDYKRLMKLKREMGANAFEVEYQLHPRESVDQFLKTEAIEACLSETAQRFVPTEDEKFDNPDKLNVWGGMDVGKEVHPSHVSFFVEVPPEKGQEMGWLVQIHEQWLDHMNYNEQVALLNVLIAYYDPIRFYFDNTRSELEDRGLTKRATGFKFKKGVKASMATLLEKRINNTFYHHSGEGDDPAAGPGVVMYGPEDTRQVRSLKQVKKDLTASETEDGHGDSFWSNALAVYACESGPRITNLGSAQDIFGGWPRTGGRFHMLDCEPDWKVYEIPDQLGLGPPTKRRKCENCGFWE